MKPKEKLPSDEGISKGWGQIATPLPSDAEIKQSIPYPNPISTYQRGKNIGFIRGARWLINKLNKR